MKKSFNQSILMLGIILSTVFIFSACKKSSTSARPGGTFTWTVGGTTYTADSDTAYLSQKVIFAYKDVATANSKIFEIDLSALSVGAYTLSASGDQINYITNPGTVVLTSQSGTLNITANASSKLSGNFTATLTGGVALTGTFTDVPIQP